VILISLRGVGVDPDTRGETLSVQLWSDGRRSITFRAQNVWAIADIQRDLERGHGPRNSGDFVAELADRLVGRMDDVIAHMEAETHRLGHAGAHGDTGKLVGELAQLRRRMLRLRRYLGPQRRALSVLASAKVDWLETDDRGQLRAVAEQTAEYAEGLDAALAITAITQDELLQRSSEKTERRIYTLTVLTAIFMPLGFITGLLGVNLAGIPDATDPMAFLFLCGLLVVIVLVQLLILCLKGWL
jgi:zinc transporter